MVVAKNTLTDLKLSDLLRVNVVGLSGSGKSTFARRLSEVLHQEYIEMDRLFHGPNWTELGEEEFRNRISKAISGEQWILDGNYHSKTQDLKWKRTTSIVWINTPFLRNIRQSTTRAFQRAWTKEELWPGTGNRETFRKTFFSSKSIILWALMNYRRIQRRYSALRHEASTEKTCFLELRSCEDAEILINCAAQLILLGARNYARATNAN